MFPSTCLPDMSRELMHCFFLSFVCFLVVIDEDEPVVNQSIVQEVVEASQRSFSQDLCKFYHYAATLLC